MTRSIVTRTKPPHETFFLDTHTIECPLIPWMLSDIGVMRLIPEMEIVTPADDWQCVRALSQTWDNGSPVFYRLSKQSAPVNAENSIGTFDRHRTEPVRAHINAKTLILGQGPCVYEVSNLDSEVAVYHLSGYSPDRELPFDMDRFRTIITVEDHLATGGLGDYVARYIATRGLKARLHTCAWSNYKTRTADLTAANPQVLGGRHETLFANRLHGILGQKSVSTVEWIAGMSVMCLYDQGAN